MIHVPARRAVAGLILLAALAAAVLFAALSSTPARAESNLNNLDCRGHIEPGEAGVLDDEDETQVKYVFACSGPITGFSIIPQNGIVNFDTDVSVFDRVSGQAVTTDSFTCNGEIEGLGFNCTGVYSGNYANVTAQFSIKGKLETEPRISPRLVVYTATRSGNTVTQSASGPFDLGRPHGLKKKTTASSSKKKTTAKKTAAKKSAKKSS